MAPSYGRLDPHADREPSAVEHTSSDRRVGNTDTDGPNWGQSSTYMKELAWPDCRFAKSSSR